MLDVVHSELIVEVGLAGVSLRAGGSRAGVKVRIEVSVLLLWLPGRRLSSPMFTIIAFFTFFKTIVRGFNKIIKQVYEPYFLIQLFLYKSLPNIPE